MNHNPYASQLPYRYETLAAAARVLAEIIHDWQLLDPLQDITFTSEDESVEASVDYELAKMALATVYEDVPTPAPERVATGQSELPL